MNFWYLIRSVTFSERVARNPLTDSQYRCDFGFTDDNGIFDPIVCRYGGYYSLAGEPAQNVYATRAQHYGFTSEMPPGGSSIVLALNGSKTTRVAVAEYLCGEPSDLASGEVLLWSRFGQRLLLNADREVSVDNGNGGTAIIAGNTTTIGDDLVVVRDATVGRDLTSQHDIGSSAGTLIVELPGPNVTNVTVAGHDKGFNLTFKVPSSPSHTLNPGEPIAAIRLGAPYASPPYCTVSAKTTAWPTPPAFAAEAIDGQQIIVYYLGQMLSGDDVERTITVLIQG